MNIFYINSKKKNLIVLYDETHKSNEIKLAFAIIFLPSFCLIAFSIQFEVAISFVIRCTDARKKKLDLIRQVKVDPTISCTTYCVKDLHYTTVTRNLSKLKLR